MEHLVSTASHEKSDYFNETNATFGDCLAAARHPKVLNVDGLSKKLCAMCTQSRFGKETPTCRTLTVSRCWQVY
ncbi:hypothetical protein OAN307_c41010 [Octadecabacter antarcticus 307]|uniref:Uncharacterized protein n=1 Tax=Octadecabacter antarcticus 307 TaxID=391626 RepID=M9RGJ3_9RHOB|nr:hypothetical protein OAN307_c41010 [Octadecabacter antarcticus 307]